MTGIKALGKRSFVIERSIERSFRRATAEEIRLGLAWYNEARELAGHLAGASGHTVEQVACAMAHLSPRQSWAVNKRMTMELVLLGSTKGLKGAIRRAKAALAAEDPWTTFGAKAHKTRSFAANIAGNGLAVTVDVWVLRLLGLSAAQLNRVGVYEDIAAAYTKVARKVGITPAQLQAITWIEIRGYAT